MDHSARAAVDDRSSLLEIISRAGSPVLGMAAVGRSQPRQVVLLDLAPTAEGRFVARSIAEDELLRRIEETPDAPMVVLTSRSAELLERAAQALRDGATSAGPACAAHSPDSGRLCFEHLRIDAGARRAWRDGDELHLTPVEFDILHLLARTPGVVFSRRRLIARVNRLHDEADERTVDVHIGRLRRKVEDDPLRPRRIATVWAKGYRFQPEYA